MSIRPLFIASIGNPGSEYAHTLHSAGHTLLSALVAYTSSPALSISRVLTGTKARCSYTPSVAFWESPSYMNDSGPDLATSWRKWSAKEGDDAALIILHDELELPIGRFSVKTGTGWSARGHNGLKSVLQAHGMRAMKITRIGVGIGPRPVSREPDEVARFVLKKMQPSQRKTVEGLAGDVWKEIEKLRQMSSGKV